MWNAVLMSGVGAIWVAMVSAVAYRVSRAGGAGSAGERT